MILSYDSYTDTLEKQKEKDDEIKIIQSQMQSILEIICNMNEGTGKNEIAKQLIEKNIYKKRK